jgi:hypothetical protein
MSDSRHSVRDMYNLDLCQDLCQASQASLNLRLDLITHKNLADLTW